MTTHLGAQMTVDLRTGRSTQAEVLGKLHQMMFDALLQGASTSGKARLRAYAAPGADAWLRATPTLIRDILLSNVAFVDVISMRLGISIFDRQQVRSKC